MSVENLDLKRVGEDLPLLEGIRTARAIRRLRTDSVPRELIRKVCEAGTFAPSGGNRQPWRFIAVTDDVQRRWIGERYKEAFHHYIGPAIELAKSPVFPDEKRGMQKAAIYLADHLHEVPVHLFVAGYTRRGEVQNQALMPAVQNILLACRAVGLGASLTTMHRRFGEELDSRLGLPPNIPTCALIPIGWPLGKYGKPLRSSVVELLFWNKFELASEQKVHLKT